MVLHTNDSVGLPSYDSLVHNSGEWDFKPVQKKFYDTFVVLNCDRIHDSTTKTNVKRVSTRDLSPHVNHVLMEATLVCTLEHYWLQTLFPGIPSCFENDHDTFYFVANLVWTSGFCAPFNPIHFLSAEIMIGDAIFERIDFEDTALRTGTSVQSSICNIRRRSHIGAAYFDVRLPLDFFFAGDKSGGLPVYAMKFHQLRFCVDLLGLPSKTDEVAWEFKYTSATTNNGTILPPPRDNNNDRTVYTPLRRLIPGTDENKFAYFDNHKREQCFRLVFDGQCEYLFFYIQDDQGYVTDSVESVGLYLNGINYISGNRDDFLIHHPRSIGFPEPIGFKPRHFVISFSRTPLINNQTSIPEGRVNWDRIDCPSLRVTFTPDFTPRGVLHVTVVSRRTRQIHMEHDFAYVR